MRRCGVVRLGLVLAGATVGWALLPAVPAGAAPGFRTVLTTVPDTLAAGGDPRTVTAVVSTSRDEGCRKVRWSLLVQVSGLRLDQVGVDRIEETGSFPMTVRAGGDTARLTDRDLDPGTLCRDRTVTAQYRIAVADDAPAGRISLTVEAYDAQGRLLDQAGATRQVTGARAERAPATPKRSTATPTPSRSAPSTSAAPSTTGPADDETTPADDATSDDATSDDSAEDAAGLAGADTSGDGTGAADRAGAVTGPDRIGPVQVGFAVGGVLLFLGVGLLLRVLSRSRENDPEPVPPARRGRAGYPPRPAARRRAAHLPDW
ncbi:hypothetical protein [Plantactinospora sp. B5E13]|uniref:hypothetical protein n=1 Tax=Plantactinospora sp. B5E13 TaxID=3153758 RepID=UPI00325D622E